MQKFCVDRGFDDGAIVTEKKVCLWLQDDLLLRRVLQPKGKGHRRHAAVKDTVTLGKRRREGNDEEKEREEVEKLERELALQLGAAGSATDQLDNVDSDGDERPSGTLLLSSTIDVYVAAV